MKNGPTPRLFALLKTALPSRRPELLALLLALMLGLWMPAATASASTKMARCSWDSPGTNPYVGTLAAAVDRYTDIPAPVRAALKLRMASQRYDDIAVIGRKHITGAASYSPELRDMHFGSGRVCSTVTRQRWAPGAEERGLVYCEAGHCLIVPTVCRNVSRLNRISSRQAGAQPPGGGGGAAAAGGSSEAAAAPPALAVLPESTELQFEAPAAGPDTPNGSATIASVAAPDGNRLGDGQGHGLFGGPAFDADAGPAGAGAGPADAWAGPFDAGARAPPLPLVPPSPWTDGGSGWLPGGPQAVADPVPEPSTWLMWTLGVAVLAAVRRRRL